MEKKINFDWKKDTFTEQFYEIWKKTGTGYIRLADSGKFKNSFKNLNDAVQMCNMKKGKEFKVVEVTMTRKARLVVKR